MIDVAPTGPGAPCVVASAVAPDVAEAPSLVPKADAAVDLCQFTSAEITLEQGECWRTCPLHSVSVRSDGTVRFNEAAVPSIPPDAARGLVCDAARSGFFGLRSSYRRCATDSPDRTITVRIDGQTRKVVRNTSNERCNGSDRAPAWLPALEEHIIKVAGVEARATARDPADRPGMPHRGM